MDIAIKYNDGVDDFTYDLNLQMRLKNYIQAHFSPAYVLSSLAPVYLVGGSIRDLIYAKTPRDLDFVILGTENLEFVLTLFKTYSIQYRLNRFGGFKFQYQGTEIDLWLTDDLYSAIQYNVDGLFFNLKDNSLLSLTFDDFCQNGLKLINEENNIEVGRKPKLIEFEKRYLRNHQLNFSTDNIEQ